MRKGLIKNSITEKWMNERSTNDKSKLDGLLAACFPRRRTDGKGIDVYFHFKKYKYKGIHTSGNHKGFNLESLAKFEGQLNIFDISMHVFGIPKSDVNTSMVVLCGHVGDV